MAANGISTLATKQERQEAKLDLAQTQRQAGGDTTAIRYRQNNTYNIDALPTKYSNNAILNNPNTGGLVQGRPWINIAGITFDPDIYFYNRVALIMLTVILVSTSPQQMMI